MGLIAPRVKVFDRAASFDGVVRTVATNCAIDCGAVGAQSGAFTVEAKIRPSQLVNYQAIAGSWGTAGTAENWLLYADATGVLYLGTNKAGGGYAQASSAAGALTVNALTDVAGTWDGITLRVFVNGALNVAGAVAQSTIQAYDGTAHLTVGQDTDTAANGYPFGGIIEEFRLSTTARYTASYTPSAIPLVADANTQILYRFDGDATDSSGNGHNGTLQGTVLPTFVQSPWDTVVAPPSQVLQAVNRSSVF